MPKAFGETTGPGKASTADHRSAPAPLALVVAWSASQPHRVGEIAFFPFGERLYVGRGDVEVEKFASFARQVPGEPPAADPRDGCLAGDSISRRQLLVRSTGAALEIQQVGRCRTFFNSEEREQAVLEPGGTVMLHKELVLLCVQRPKIIPRPRGVRHIQLFGEPDAHGIVGEGPEAWQLREDLALAALTSDHGLVEGETGTGKELAAGAIHKQSIRASKPYIARNASTFPLTLLASELFGSPANYPNHGMPARKGLMGAADQGTLFLDEIGDFPVDAQTQLLRVMDQGEYQALGEATMRRVDVRVVGATNKDTSAFRADFFARFLTRVRVAPLRERREDIPLLIRWLVLERAQKSPKTCQRFIREEPDGRLEPRISARFVDYLVRQPLPDNMRELRRVLVEAINASDGDEIRMPAGDSTATGTSTRPPAGASQVEPGAGTAPGIPSKDQVTASLDRERGNVARVARGFGMSRPALYRLMESYGIKRDPRD